MPYYFIFSFITTALLVKLYLDKLCKIKFFKKGEKIDQIKKSCIKELHHHKMNIPTMGGMAINITLLLCSVFYFITTGTFFYANLFLIGFGLLGFCDDYIKLKKIRDGVSPREKLIGLFFLGMLIVLYFVFTNQLGDYLLIPFTDYKVQIGVATSVFLSVFIIVASANSMNITDGLDGLALGIGSIVLGFIIYFAFKLGAQDVLFTSVILEGGCLAMLLYNRHPAKVFMGDTGSLFLGAAISVLLIRLNLSFWIVLMFAPCIFETVSVILQLFWLRYFKRGLFKIAPFHHHLEKCGYSEKTIVFWFYLATLICCIFSYFAFGGGL